MWKIIFTKKADKELSNFSSEIRKQILKAVEQKLLLDPDRYLIPLVGDMSGLYKFRINDYRLLCNKDGQKLIITVVKVKHRKEVYK